MRCATRARIADDAESIIQTALTTHHQRAFLALNVEIPSILLRVFAITAELWRFSLQEKENRASTAKQKTSLQPDDITRCHQADNPKIPLTHPTQAQYGAEFIISPRRLRPRFAASRFENHALQDVGLAHGELTETARPHDLF